MHLSYYQGEKNAFEIIKTETNLFFLILLFQFSLTIKTVAVAERSERTCLISVLDQILDSSFFNKTSKKSTT